MKNPLASILHSCVAEYDSLMIAQFLPSVTVVDGVTLGSAERVNRWVSDVCSSREGQMIANSMAIAGLSPTAARARVKLNAKGTEASEVYLEALALLDFCDAYRVLTKQLGVYTKPFQSDSAETPSDNSQEVPAKRTRKTKPTPQREVTPAGNGLSTLLRTPAGV